MADHDLDALPPMQHDKLYTLLLAAPNNKVALTLPVQLVAKWTINFTNWLSKNHPDYRLLVDDTEVGKLIVHIEKRESKELNDAIWE